AIDRSDLMCSLGHRTLLSYLDAGDAQALRDFLSSRQHQVDDRDENGTTILMLAASRGSSPFCRELLSLGADAAAEDHDSWTAMHFAARNGHAAPLRALIEHGAPKEHRDMGGWTPLLWASYRGHTECVRILLDAGADVQARGGYNLSALLWAAGRGHTEVVRLLVERGAKVNVADKYGTTALVWACRRGCLEIVDILLKAGASVDSSGMYSWTPLLVAVQNRHQEVVSRLLQHKPNVNALDSDGATALAIACREGLAEIAHMLVNAGAYVNLQDRTGDSQLIHAVKGGHRGIVESLLKRHADLDVPGRDRKTAIYTAVEKGHTAIVRLLLAANPDLEIQTKDGDTALLRAVRTRNVEIVTLLLDKKAKINAVDFKGDTCLHIAMRARSKAIVEVLLRNPKHSQLLYRPNKAGETAYNIDMHHPKTILGQIYGARRLNTNEDCEGMLGYELYSSALADILSDPGLTMPITVGLYAKWGSGKSFLLSKLKEEMKSFARQWCEPVAGAPWLAVWLCAHLALLVGLATGLGTFSWIWGLAAGLITVGVLLSAYLSLRVASNRYDCYWPYNLNVSINRRLNSLKLLLQVLFCHPPGPRASSAPSADPVHFYFADQNKGAGADGEGAMVHMLTSLFEVIERDYGLISTRLFRAFRPRPFKSNSGWRFRRFCCFPNILLFEVTLLAFIATASLGLYCLLDANQSISDSNLTVVLMALGLGLAVILTANIQSLGRAAVSLIFGPKHHLQNAIKNNSDPITGLANEVALMSDLVTCLDAFTNQQSRLVGIIDALDSCDVEKIIAMLNSVHQLLSEPKRPFIVLLAVDPHIISKAVESKSRRVFSEGSIGGHDFLRNLVHLPVYLQNSGLRQAQRAQSTALVHRSRNKEDDGEMLTGSVSNRRLSSASELMASQEKLRPPRGSRKLRLSDSIASSIGSNLHRVGTAGGAGSSTQPHWDLSKMLLADDYFSDVNPRSMRRLMNVIYITGRLLKAFHIDFNWYRLCSWINLTEQWPLRASLIVLYHDNMGDRLDDNSSLHSLYDKVRAQVPALKEAAPLLELDRDERKLDAFLSLHKTTLQVADLRVFMPFTINLDPYLRKVLKEDQQNMEDESVVTNVRSPPTGIWQPIPNVPQMPWMPQQMIRPTLVPPIINAPQQQPNMQQWWPGPMQNDPRNYEPPFNLPIDIPPCRLSSLSCDDIEKLMLQVDELKPLVPSVAPKLHQNCVTGRVLANCDLKELKSVLGITFGHWEVFRMFVEGLRVMEMTPQAPWNCHQRPHQEEEEIAHTIVPPRIKPDTIEKQVTLEEQTICGALQTLNEEALEDVLSGDSLPKTNGTGKADETYAVPVSNGGRSAPSTPPNIKRELSILKHSGSLKIGPGKHVSYESKTTNGELSEDKIGNSHHGRPATLTLVVQSRRDRSHDLASDDESAPLVTPLTTASSEALEPHIVPTV
ncbi:kinase D-interacting substrate of 220 kDa B-like, partial [Ctenocephalides felis]|uniref:kinase D-interacting substrate of 220 kDa B-like n=1 Tax=Ctenocephalides felis TaxID=7515 RepID=UPI000E6E453B